MAVNWSELPPELLETIATKLTIYIDYVRFRAVCKNWRSNVSGRPNHLPCQLPWLMLPYGQNSGNRRGFFSLPENKVHRLQLPELRRKRCCGSSEGWLVIVEESPAIHLLNPLTGVQLQLPPLTTCPNVLDFNISEVGREYVIASSGGYRCTGNLKDVRDGFMKKVILSGKPTSNNGNYIAMAIINGTGDLVFCKKGDEAWTNVEDAQSYCEDVIYHKGLFYAVNKEGAVAICNVAGRFPMVTVIAPPPLSGGDILYLVDSLGELLLVTRYLDLVQDLEHHLVYQTVGFEVFKLDLSGPKWAQVKSLGDSMLFLGQNSSLSLSASSFSGCEGNCIYFTDDYSEANDDDVHGNHDLGVFNLGNGRIEPLLCYPSKSQLIWPPPIWVTPNPC